MITFANHDQRQQYLHPSLLVWVYLEATGHRHNNEQRYILTRSMAQHTMVRMYHNLLVEVREEDGIAKPHPFFN